MSVDFAIADGATLPDWHPSDELRGR